MPFVYIIYCFHDDAVTDGGSLVLDLESATEFAEFSEVLDTVLLLSSFSAAVSTSIGSSLSSFATAPLVPSELSLDEADFFVTASPDATSIIPFVFEEESFEVAEEMI